MTTMALRPANKVLFCVLNWGLGHAARCIPLVKHYVASGTEVHLASDGGALSLLQVEFPQLQSFILPSYHISYGKRGLGLGFASKLPDIARAIQEEKKAIANLCAQHSYDVIVSDNRYGCYSNTCFSIMVSHQLSLITPWSALDSAANRVQAKLFSSFDEIWVPDFKDDRALAGRLSRSARIKLPTQYLGPLSRMKKEHAEQKQDILVVLSGPEPQRSILEAIVLEQAQKLSYRFLVVRGVFESSNTRQAADNISIVNQLGSKELEAAMNASSMAICRSGYTSIMDLYALAKRAILIPTPGQTEQEYLAKYHQKNKNWVTRSQDAINLKLDIPKVLAMDL